MPARYTVEITARRSFGRMEKIEFAVDKTFKAEPGQFVHVRCEKQELILRRPYSLCEAGKDTASIMVRDVGAGSAWLCATKAGQTLDIMGPMGRGFSIEGGGMHALIAGGTGVAPMIFLASRLESMGGEATLFWGVESEDEYEGLAGELGAVLDLRLATMDGGSGFAGSAVDLYMEAPTDGAASIYACGPRGMLAALAESIDSEELAGLQVCMEERMACGIGACRGCVVPAAAPPGSYLAACRDGPVFRGGELDWKRMRG